MRVLTDGVVTIRPPADGDAAALVAGRDAEFHRFLGEGDPVPAPLACIVVGGEIVGWCDYDVDRPWLEPAEVNVGYNVFAGHRGHGYGTRAVKLLVHHLATSTEYAVATFLIAPDNLRSQALAARTGATRVGDLDGNPYFKLVVPPLTYTDGIVTIRRQSVDDINAHLAAIDDAQIDWLWEPGDRASWEAMTPDQQRAHNLRHLASTHDSFGAGPKWCFSADLVDAPYVVYVDCDLANTYVPAGEANISYTADPAHRGKGYVARAVRLACRFLRDHTGARDAHIVVDPRNVDSLRVAAAVGAAETERFADKHGRPMIRHVLPIR
jgi:RimJ/RimL family protein N-acetyltransferase